ncbi:hypothetical protein IT571_12125, partial [Candidatus Sumerlaeota bacterium]|nr:hypothetical protein [Candidatus Sumerlaeota bacterium]
QHDAIPFGERSPVVCGLIYGCLLAFFMALCLGIVKRTDIDWVVLLLSLPAFYRPVAWQASAAIPLAVFGAALSSNGLGVLLLCCATGIALANAMIRYRPTERRELERLGFTGLLFLGYFAALCFFQPVMDVLDRFLWTGLIALIVSAAKSLVLFGLHTFKTANGNQDTL